MRLRTTALLGLATFLLVATADPIAAQSNWSKRSEDVVVDGDTHAKWSCIYKKGAPHESRMLYEDADGRPLVIRATPDSTDPNLSTVSIEDLASGEVLLFAFDEADKLVTLSLGASQVVIDFDEVIAEMGPDGTQFPTSIASASQALIGGASQDFQDSLRRIAEVGCYDSIDIYVVAVRYAHLFYSDIDCAAPPNGSMKTQVLALTPDFDPSTDAPTPFEVQFGQAYYQ